MTCAARLQRFLAAALLVGWPAAAGAQAPVPDAHSHQGHQHEMNDPPADPAATDAGHETASGQPEGHTVHDKAVHYYVLFDQLEWQNGDGSGINWDNKGWIGRDLDRLWFRSEIESDAGRVSHSEVHVLYGRAIARWWDLVGGVRQDLGPGPARTWAAVGVQGLAPYWFEVEATAYVGESGGAALRLETEYELLVTNRLIVQPVIELNFYSRSDPARGIGAGLSRAEGGLRLRYEIRREVAPYVGISWSRPFGRTAELAAANGDDTGGAKLATGVRLWF